jgi:hypothetical protein
MRKEARIAMYSLWEKDVILLAAAAKWLLQVINRISIPDLFCLP